MLPNSGIGKGHTWCFIEVQHVAEVVVNFINASAGHSGLCPSFSEVRSLFPTQSPYRPLMLRALVMTLGTGPFLMPLSTQQVLMTAPLSPVRTRRTFGGHQVT